MTISRVKPGGWGVNEKLTSGQASQLDLSLASALDKTVAGDVLAGVIALAAGGRIRQLMVDGADADTTYTVATAQIVRLSNTITADRTYTLSATGAADGDVLAIYCENGFGYRVTVMDPLLLNPVMTLGLVDTEAVASACAFVFKSGSWWILNAARPPGARSKTFLSSGSWTCPPGVYRVRVYLCGGGGGGGGSWNGNAVAGDGTGGGGGGGGAQLAIADVDTIPGNSYNVVIGNGGGGGVAGTYGSSGGSSSFHNTTAQGAQGGANNTIVASGAPAYSLGGNTVYDGSAPQSVSYTTIKPVLVPGAGGIGATGTSPASAKAGAPQGANIGGAVGTTGTDGGGGTWKAGGSGGGGGGGAFGIGGAGGGGGHGSVAVATAGNAGVAALANTGGGGGGAGGGGCGAAGGGAGATGGNGGSGRVVITW